MISFPTARFPSILHRRPEVIRVKKLRELPIHIDYVNVSLVSISNHSFRVLALFVPVHIDTQTSVDLQLQTDLIVHQTSPRIFAAIHTLQLQLL